MTVGVVLSAVAGHAYPAASTGADGAWTETNKPAAAAAITARRTLFIRTTLAVPLTDRLHAAGWCPHLREYRSLVTVPSGWVKVKVASVDETT